MKRILALVSLAALSACSGNSVKNTLGLGRAAPDEFRVVSRPPLSVPPQFDLRPPSATAEAPGQMPAPKQAQSILTGAPGSEVILTPGTASTAVTPVTASSLDKPAAKPASNAEAQFLRNAGADKVDETVREKIVQDSLAHQDAQEENDNWWSKLSVLPPKKDPLVNAQAESDRIKKNEDDGAPVTEGETPTVKDRDTGVLGRIFGY